MNEDDYLKLLQRVDDASYAEHPPDFNLPTAKKRFDTLVRVLEQRLGCSVRKDDGVQNASHHGEAYLPSILLQEDYITSVRVSNFGNLATIYDEDSVVKPEYLTTIIALLEEHGYTYIPSEVLHMPYTGQNHGVSGFGSWGLRFFDYI